MGNFLFLENLQLRFFPFTLSPLPRLGTQKAFLGLPGRVSECVPPWGGRAWPLCFSQLLREHTGLPQIYLPFSLVFLIFGHSLEV